MSLPYGAEIILGGTVNLGNYENIRFEIRGSVRDQVDLDALKASFRTTLLSLGTGSPETRAAVTSFVDRVIPGELSETPAPTPETKSTPAPVREPAPAAIPPAPKEMHVPSKPTEAPAPAPAPAPATAPKKEIGAGFICSNCGAQMTASEEKTSRLFVSRPLCKDCLKLVKDSSGEIAAPGGRA
jgi:predicted component of type VI protein secretion system